MEVKKLLKHFGIPFSEHHIAVTSKCIGVDCPFCGDTNKHCGVFLNTGGFTCWKCSAKGSLFKLINKIKYISYEEYTTITGARSREGGTKSELDKIFNTAAPKPKKEFDIIALKSEMKKFMVPITQNMQTTTSYFWLIQKFINDRQFTIEFLEKQGALYAHSERYQGRLVIPIPPPYKSNGNTVGIIARDLTETAINKYLFPFGFKVHNHIYLPFKVSSSIRQFVIVEGILDAWAIAPFGYPIAIFGKNLNDSQLFKIIDTINYPRQSEMVIMLDGDASLMDAQKISGKLHAFFKKVRIVNLPEKEDPASIDRNELQKILKSCR